MNKQFGTIVFSPYVLVHVQYIQAPGNQVGSLAIGILTDKHPNRSCWQGNLARLQLHGLSISLHLLTPLSRFLHCVQVLLE